MKIHRILCEAVIESLLQIFERGDYADKVIEKTLRSNKKWGARDRAFIAESVYEIVRHARKYFAIAGQEAKNRAEWWRILGIHLFISGQDVPDFEEFSKTDFKALVAKYEQSDPPFSVRESIPDWLDEMGRQQLGDQWEPTVCALNSQAPVVLRANTLKTTREALKKALENDGFETDEIGVAGLILKKRANVFRTSAFADGWFEIQDAASQLVAEHLDVKPGMRVVDACAGAGGKTLHLAALMQNKGSIIALDTVEWKLKELSKRARRAGAHIIETRLISSKKTIKRLREQADRLLLDVPCSGLGVLRRNPDAKWKITPEKVTSLETVQAEILDDYSMMLKPGGKMAYATCSILPSENARQIERFLSRQAGKMELVSEQKIFPQDDGYDGFYIAVLQKI